MLQNTKRVYRSEALWPGIFLILGFLFPGLGCNTRVEGCLDIAAENFDLDADRACGDCCTYPSISISLSQKWNDKNFSTADTLMDSNGSPFRITDLKYFLSSWEWQDAVHSSYTVDSAEIRCNENILRYTPDILIIDSRQFQYTLGTFRKSPLMDSIQLKLGILPALDCVDAAASGTPAILSNLSPLWDHQLSSRAAIRIILQRNLELETFDSIYIHTFQNMKVNYDLDLKAGIPATLDLSVDYARWFSNADIQNLNSFQNSVMAGFQGSIFKTP